MSWWLVREDQQFLTIPQSLAAISEKDLWWLLSMNTHWLMILMAIMINDGTIYDKWIVHWSWTLQLIHCHKHSLSTDFCNGLWSLTVDQPFLLIFHHLPLFLANHFLATINHDWPWINHCSSLSLQEPFLTIHQFIIWQTNLVAYKIHHF